MFKVLVRSFLYGERRFVLRILELELEVNYFGYDLEKWLLI